MPSQEAILGCTSADARGSLPKMPQESGVVLGNATERWVHVTANGATHTAEYSSCKKHQTNETLMLGLGNSYMAAINRRPCALRRPTW